MKDKVAVMLAIAFVISAFAVMSPATDGETGSWIGIAEDDWYGDDKGDEFTINSAEELAGLAKLVNDGNNFAGKTVKLGSDIDLGGKNWIPIGVKVLGDEKDSQAKPFKGTFDGNGKTISNMSISHAGYLGLFGYTNGAKVFDLIIEKSDIYYDASPGKDDKIHSIGTLGGFMSSTEISKISIKDTTIRTGFDEESGKSDHDAGIGGMVGNHFTGSSTDCHAENVNISVQGNYVGGLVGSTYAKISNCSVNNVKLNVDGFKVGGVLGSVQGTTDPYIVEQWHANNVTMDVRYDFDSNGVRKGLNAGGLIGFLNLENDSPVNLKNCSAVDIRFISDKIIDQAGGLIGTLYVPEVGDKRSVSINDCTSESDFICPNGEVNNCGGAIGSERYKNSVNAPVTFSDIEVKTVVEADRTDKFGLVMGNAEKLEFTFSGESKVASNIETDVIPDREVDDSSIIEMMVVIIQVKIDGDITSTGEISVDGSWNAPIQDLTSEYKLSVESRNCDANVSNGTLYVENIREGAMVTLVLTSYDAPSFDDDDEFPFIPGQGASGNDDTTTYIAVAAAAAVVAILAVLVMAMSKGKI